MAKASNAELVAEIEALRQSLQTERRERQRLQEELEQCHTSLAEALEQQTATSDILRVISRSPTDIQPVIDTVAESSARLCEAFDTSIYRLDGDRLLLVAHHGPIPVGRVGEFTLPLVRGTVAGRTMLEARTVHITDVQTESEEFPESSQNAERMGFRTILSVPLMRDGVAIGVITPRRTEARLFTERQVALLQTFADQAVIAIENVRLFTELQEKNRALTQAHTQVTEALEQRTATSEILRVISSSPADLEPVFGTLLVNAARLCGAYNGGIFRFEGGALHIAASYNISAEFRAHLESAPIQPGPGGALRRAALELQPVQNPDASGDTELPAAALEAYRRKGMRTAIAVPLLKENTLIGAIAFHRREVRPFSEQQIALLKTFADQAVIAIENVRLFTELESRNRDLTESLDQQLPSAIAFDAQWLLAAATPSAMPDLLAPITASVARLEAMKEALLLPAAGIVPNFSSPIVSAAPTLLSVLTPPTMPVVLAPSVTLPAVRAAVEPELYAEPRSAGAVQAQATHVNNARSIRVDRLEVNFPAGSTGVNALTPQAARDFARRIRDEIARLDDRQSRVAGKY